MFVTGLLKEVQLFTELTFAVFCTKTTGSSANLLYPRNTMVPKGKASQNHLKTYVQHHLKSHDNLQAVGNVRVYMRKVRIVKMILSNHDPSDNT